MVRFRKIIFFVAFATLVIPSFAQTDDDTTQFIVPDIDENFIPNPAEYDIQNGIISESKLKKYLKRNIQIFLHDMTPTPSCGTSWQQNDFFCWMDFISYTKPKMIQVGGGIGDANRLVNGCFTTIMQSIENHIHAIDPQIILIGSINESYIDPNLFPKNLMIPQWVKDELPELDLGGITYFDMVPMQLQNAANGNYVHVDITQPMTQAYYYYLGRQLIDLGYEALKLCQIGVTAQHDAPDYHHTYYIVNKLRQYGKVHGRRGFVLLESHTSGLNYHNPPDPDSLIFDFHSNPLGLLEIPGGKMPAGNGFTGGFDYETAIAELQCNLIYNNSLGGNHPLGWYTQSTPYYVEVDNNGGGPDGNSQPPPPGQAPPVVANMCHFPWRWDEATWYQQQSTLYKNHFLLYLWHKVRCVDTNQAGYLQFMGNRDAIPVYPGPFYYFKAFDCDGGAKQSKLIKGIWDAHDDNPPANTKPYYNRWVNDFLQTFSLSHTNLPTGKLYYGDFNGDGNIDILETANNAKGQTWSGWNIFLLTNGIYNLNNPDYSASYPSWGEKFYIGDYDSDGKDDFMVTADGSQNIFWQGWKLYTNSNNYGLVAQDTFPSWGERLYPCDFNGDGKDDLIVTADESLTTGYSWLGYKTYTSLGNGFTYTFSSNWPGWGEKFYIGDFNGDNKQEFLVTSDNKVNFTPWEGYIAFKTDGTDFQAAAFNQFPGRNEIFVINDWNKDGYDDFSVVSRGGTTSWNGVKTYLGNNLGNHFMFATHKMYASNPPILNAQYFGFRNQINNFVQTTSSLSNSISVWNPLHCSTSLWSSQKQKGTGGITSDNPHAQLSYYELATSLNDIHNTVTNTKENAFIMVSPNPTMNGIFEIIMTKEMKGTIMVTDLQGKNILEKQILGTKDVIDLSQQNNGLYILIVNSKDTIIRQKLVINK